MTKRARTGGLRKKAHRFGALAKLRREQPHLFEALERRDRAQSERLSATRSRARKTASSIERRREQYLEIPAPQPSVPIPRKILATIAASFVAPIVLAIVGSAFYHHAQVVAVHTQRNVRTSLRHLAGARHANVVASAAAAPHAAIHATQVVHPHVPEKMSAGPVVVARHALIALRPIAKRAMPIAGQNHTSRPRAAQTAPSLAGRFVASVLQTIFGSAPQPPPAPARHVAVSSRLASRAVLPKPVAARGPAANASEASPWSLDADGMWVATVHAPASMTGATFSASTGQLIELEPSAVASDEATVTIGWARPVTVDISAQGQTLVKTLPAPDAGAEAFDVAARAVGPHLVNVGWTPLGDSVGVSQYEVFRSTGEGDRPELVATLPANKHAYHDVDVDPDSRYRYSIAAETSEDSIQASAPTVQTPDALPVASARVVSGKGMFLYFSSLLSDPRNFRRYDPDHVIAEAQHAGIHVIELRMARGACTMAQTDAAHAWLDDLVDDAAAAGIKLLAWTVPRRDTTQDLAETIAAAEYRTPAGNGFDGVALDLETGANYMGDGAKARERMVQYIHDVRAAAGPQYLIVATVASPSIGDQTAYPYAAIARYADVLQPMEYWHYFDEAAHHEYGRGEVASAATDAVTQTRELAGRDIPVNVAGQSVALEGTDAPSGREISWSLDASKSGGAIGETFFDWAGTGPDAWAAIQAFDW